MEATSIGSLVSHRPTSALRKSGMPDGVLTPAPVRATTCWAARNMRAARSISACIAMSALDRSQHQDARQLAELIGYDVAGLNHDERRALFRCLEGGLGNRGDHNRQVTIQYALDHGLAQRRRRRRAVNHNGHDLVCADAGFFEL